MPSGINLLMTPAASQANDENAMAALWGSQSWLQPAFSRPFAGHEGSLTQEPPERRPQRGPQGKIARPTSIFRGRLPLCLRAELGPAACAPRGNEERGVKIRGDRKSVVYANMLEPG